MKHTLKVILVVIITAVIAGGGVYYWQQNLPEPTPPVVTEKTFDREGFSFVYPAEYVVDNNALWTNEGYQSHINPLYGCDTCQIPEVQINNFKTDESTDKTLEEFISDKVGLPSYEKTPEEVKTQLMEKYPYEEVKIGENNFIKIVISDMMDVTSYYTKKGNQVVEFEVYSTDKDNQKLKDIISTLKFK